jgi:hypothetical protein
MKGGFSFGSLSKKVSELASSVATSINSDDLSYLENVIGDLTLQVPQFHSGLLIAFSNNHIASTTLTKDIKYSWFRAGFKREDIETLDESSKRAWYAPTADDIGFKVCVQCEDMHGLGFSRYREVSRNCYHKYSYIKFILYYFTVGNNCARSTYGVNC